MENLDLLSLLFGLLGFLVLLDGLQQKIKSHRVMCFLFGAFFACTALTLLDMADVQYKIKQMNASSQSPR